MPVEALPEILSQEEVKEAILHILRDAGGEILEEDGLLIFEELAQLHLAGAILWAWENGKTKVSVRDGEVCWRLAEMPSEVSWL